MPCRSWLIRRPSWAPKCAGNSRTTKVIDRPLCDRLWLTRCHWDYQDDTSVSTESVVTIGQPWIVTFCSCRKNFVHCCSCDRSRGRMNIRFVCWCKRNWPVNCKLEMSLKTSTARERTMMAPGLPVGKNWWFLTSRLLCVANHFCRESQCHLRRNTSVAKSWPPVLWMPRIF